LEPRRPPIEEMITTEPLPRSAIGGIANAQSQMLLLMLLPMILSKASSLMSSSGP
jgi:hypothetical protein